MLIAGTPSSHGNKYAQVFVMNFGWCRVYPMHNKSHANEAFSLLFKQEGVPPDMICDGYFQQTKGHFAHKCHKADCHLWAIEPYSLWMNTCKLALWKLN